MSVLKENLTKVNHVVLWQDHVDSIKVVAKMIQNVMAVLSASKMICGLFVLLTFLPMQVVVQKTQYFNLVSSLLPLLAIN